MSNKSCFITFEGGEGAGKSTLIRKVYDYLFAQNYFVVKTREPGGSVLGEKIRDILLHKENISPLAEVCLFLASRAEHVKEVIKPALKENKVVLCDRFNDSTVAYQGYARDLGVDEVQRFCDFVCDGVKIDLTVYLDIDPFLGLKRIKSEKYDRIESECISFHRKIREGFLFLAKKNPERFLVVDAKASIEDVFRKVIKKVLEIIDGI